MKSKIIVIVGPTAAGKSALAIEIARSFNGEIVSCDSMQVYKYMNIGTAKPSDADLSLVRHHLIDIADPNATEPFSCASFAVMANEAINDIISRGKVPVLCGGTGLYIDSIVNATEFSDMKNDLSYREELFALASEKGNTYVHSLLEQIDPESASSIHPNNLKRVIRALEIYKFTGRTKTEWDAESHEQESPYEATFLGITYLDRDKLYERIDKRVDLMMKEGLFAEASELYKKEILRKGTTASQAIGYKELFSVILGETELDVAVEEIKRETRRYAKRQLTWFKRNTSVKWFYPDEAYGNVNESTFEIIVNNASEYLKSQGFCDIM